MHTPIVAPPTKTDKTPASASAGLRVTTRGEFARRTGLSRRGAKDRLPALKAEAEAAIDSMLAAGNAGGAIGFAEGILARLEFGTRASDGTAHVRQEECEGAEDVAWANYQHQRTPARRQAWRRTAHALMAATMAKLAEDAAEAQS